MRFERPSERLAEGNARGWKKVKLMSYRNVVWKLAAVAGVLAVAVLAYGSGEARLVALTRYFCSAAVGVCALASAVGLATRLRA